MAEQDDRGAGCFLQFAKAPVAGNVKTRLQPELLPHQAAAVARLLTEHVAAALSDVPDGWDVRLFVDRVDDPFLMQLASTHRRELHAQGDGDLGQRMLRAISATLLRYRHAIVVGSDCIAYDRAYLRSAAQALQAGNDAVLGPATDDGYVLIGFSRCHADVFAGIEWSCDSVLGRQRAQLSRLGLTWQELPVRADIDTPADLYSLYEAGLVSAAEIKRW